MGHIFKLFLTLNSLSLSLMVFFIKEGIVLNSLHPYLSNLPNIISYVVYFLMIVMFTKLSMLLIHFLDTDTIEAGSISTIEPANDAFLPSYLGYFFVALSVPNIEVFLCIFGIIGIFVFSSRISYFNPIFFLFGYHFYSVVNNKNIKVLIITRKRLKEPKRASFQEIKRINDYTFIDMEGR